ncbi:MAG: N-acetyltransferase [Gammaproteobacteria bacterium]
MSDELEIRNSLPGDSGAIDSLYSEAFPDENLLPLVHELLRDDEVCTSLLGVVTTQIVGHVIFSSCGIAGSNVNAALLGPLAVASTWQRQGIGSGLVRAGLQRLREMDVSLVCVLGDPAYYKRLGFLPESLLEPPYRLPPEYDGAWQSRRLGDVTALSPGKLSVPRQWLQPALWLP